MADLSKWTNSERMFAAGLHHGVGKWTPHCLDPEDVLLLVDPNSRNRITVTDAKHLTQCTYCQRTFAETRQLFQLSTSLASSVVTLRDGNHVLSLNPDGTLHIAWDIPAGLMRDVIALLKTQRVAVSRSLLQPLGGLQSAARGNTIRTRGSTESHEHSGEAQTSFALLQPIGTLLLEDRPAFRWQPLPTAAHYHIAIIDEKAVPQVIMEEQVTESTWTPSIPLPRSVVLKWEVSAADSQGNEIAFAPLPPVRARLRILELAQAIRLENQFKAYASSPLLRGLLAAKAGLLDYAEQAFSAVGQANPDNPIAQELLQSVKALRSSPS